MMPFAALIKSTASGNQYSITADRAGVVSCSCPAWKHAPGPKVDRTCKHLRAMKNALKNK